MVLSLPENNFDVVIDPLIRKASITRKSLYDSARKLRIGEKELLDILKMRAECVLEILRQDSSPNAQTRLSIGKGLHGSIEALQKEIASDPQQTITIRPDIIYKGMFNDLRRVCSLWNMEDKHAALMYEFLLFMGQIGMVSRSSAQVMMEVLANSIIKNGVVTLFVANSKSIDPDSSVLRNKPQYFTNEYLRNKVESFVQSHDLSVEYICLLPDLDPKFPIERCDELWQMNLEQIRSYTSAKCVRLSMLSASVEVDRKFVLRTLEKEIADFTERQSTLIEFHADADFAAHQIVNYATAGIIFEEIFPNGILLDIQKRSYPFEQPYYSRLRKNELPIVYCGQKDGNPL